ncbi:uncharacterized protein LOC125946177 isoform X2 [Dermacentor silvarum]|uniref:uncharacterized protein LOC125946177 isoform X2 n=1 Tax=Dermacentor silvarum TaxID=543639 RepID=UPI002101A254|nr:uncharacterized protein LOC125946177 isoform X2 [Dermacentor silvarum]
MDAPKRKKANSNRMCSEPQCKNRAVAGEVSLHVFPRHKKLRKLWAARMRIGKEVTGEMYVCNEHFKQEDYFWSNLDGSLKPRLPRLKKGAVPSLKMPVRTHETQVKPRPSRRKLTEASHGMKPDDLPPAVSREEVCACVPPVVPCAAENCDQPVQAWLSAVSTCPSSHVGNEEMPTGHTEAEVQNLLHQLQKPELQKSSADKAMQANVLHDMAQKFKLTELLTTDYKMNAFTGIPNMTLLNKIV